VTPPAGQAPRRGARSGWPAADLGAIRRSEEIIEMLAGRRIPARLRTDPAVALLSSLNSDVDGAACPPADWRAGPRHRAGRARPRGSGPRGARPRSARPRSAWPHAAAAAAVAAAIATLTAVAAATLMVVGMFARLSAARARRPRY
jgi:hypothetical protein